ncbi:MAG: hypothetical protein ABR511_15245 [Acidimicrobiales bacterium]
MSDADLAALASSQGGMVARHQARDHMTAKQLKNRLATGRLVVVRRGVYRFAGSPEGRWDDLRAACLAEGPAAVASHRSAAELWGMAGIVAEQPEITVPAPMWPRLPGVRGHQSARLPHAHVTMRHGIPVTSPARTVTDLSAELTSGVLGRLVDECLRRRITDLRQLRAVHDLLVGAAAGLGTLRAVLDLRQPGHHPGDSPGELDLCRLLVDAGLPSPVPQHQVVAGRTVYVLDLAYPEIRLGLEYDGWTAHGTRSAFDHDRARGNALAAAGWTMLHFTSGMAADRLQAAAVAAYHRTARATGPSEGQLSEEAG